MSDHEATAFDGGGRIYCRCGTISKSERTFVEHLTLKKEAGESVEEW